MTLETALKKWIEADTCDGDPFPAGHVEIFLEDDIYRGKNPGKGWNPHIQKVFDAFEGDPVELIKSVIAYKKITQP